MQQKINRQVYDTQALRRVNTLASHYMHISAYQGSMLILCANTGASFLILPGILGGTFRTAAWCIVVCGALVSALCALLIHFAYQKSGARSYHELFCRAFGRHTGGFAALLLRIASLVRAGFTVGIFAGAVKGLIQPDSGHVLICLGICAALLAVLRRDTTASARFCSIGMLFLFTVLLLMFTCSPAMHSAYILPLTLPTRSQTTIAWPYVLFCASGTDILLYIYPHLQNKPLRTCLGGAALGCAAKLYALFLSCSIFGFYSIGNYTWPLITMFKASNLIGIDRPELIFMIFFTMISLTPAYLYANCAIDARTGTNRRSFVISIFACIAVFCVAAAIRNASMFEAVLRFAGCMFGVIGLVLPLACLLFAKPKQRSAV